MDETSIKRAEFYERKAAEARAKADSMRDLEARRTMLSCVPVGNTGPIR